jgi:D-sedoheptulose 7-phosphate isomerase
MDFANQYLAETLPLFQEYRSDTFKTTMAAMTQAYQHGSTIFICGNGGSAGTSNHMVNDLSKGTVVEGKKRLRVIGLADNMSLLTAYANDNGYETIFVEQLKSLWAPGDILIAISASGNSPNVVKAAEYARLHHGEVISLVGFSGGKLKDVSNFSFHFKSFNYGAVEDAQLMFSHLSSQYLHQFIKHEGRDLVSEHTPSQMPAQN